jgi:ATPase subunit of ABC transporter with duplicated ATPase domains
LTTALALSYLKATDLTLAFQTEPLFDGLDFTLGGDDRVALVGPNGVGKSTLLKILAGRSAPNSGRVELGPNTRLGCFAQQVPDPEETVGAFLRGALAEIFDIEARMRELEAQLADTADEDSVLAEYGTLFARFEDLDGWTAQDRVEDVRRRLDVAHLADDAKLAQVSGGEQARLMLARVLLAEPTLLLLDEPTNHLDADAAAWLGDYLARFPGGVLVISHDRAFLDRVADRVVELDGIHDELQEYVGGYTEYKAEKQARWQKLLLDYEAQEKHRERLAADIEATKGHAAATENATANDHWRRIAKKVAKKAKARERRLERELQSARWIAEPRTRPALTLAFGKGMGQSQGQGVGKGKGRREFALQAKDVRVVAGDRLLLDGVDLEIRNGDRLLITGPNGAGKSSLLAEIERLMPDTEVGVLPQTHDHLRLETSVIDYFRSRVPVYPEDAEQILTGYLFGEEQWSAQLRTLSAGELRRLLLAILVNQGARVLLLDEPTNYLDFDSLDVIERALREFAGTIVAVSHDAYFAEAVGFAGRWHVAGGRLRTE